MRRLLLSALALSCLQACGAPHPERPTAQQASHIQDACRSGHQTGADCELADKVLAEEEHKGAEAAFRKMSGAN